MKFKIDKKQLEAAFASLIRLAAHSSVEVIQATLQKNILRLTATDLMATLCLDVLCESEDSGEFLILGPRFWPVLKELPEGEMTVTIGQNSVNVDWEKGNCQFPVSGDEKFPPLPRIGADSEMPIHTLNLTRDDIFSIVSGVLPATADKEAEMRPVLGGAFFDADGEAVTVVGTDGQMLLTRGVPVRVPQEEPFSFLVPKATIALLALVLPEDSDTVSLHCDGKVFQCAGEGYRLTSLCIESKFPAYRTIMPNGEGGRLTVDRKQLHAAVRRVAAMTAAKDEKDTVVFSLHGGITPELELEAQNLLDFSSVRERMECGWDGEDIRIGFKVQRLLAMISCTEAERLTFVISGDKKPVLVLPEGDEDARGVMMPVPFREFVEIPKRGRK